MIEAYAPAKVNLSLRVSTMDRSGFHPLFSRVQMVDWCDRILVSWHEDEDILEVIGDDDVPTGRGNLIWKAAEVFWAGSAKRRPTRVVLHKDIPMAAGLAGGSADAAGMAVALKALTGLPLDTTAIAGLGADVAFSLLGGGAVMEGFGEELTPEPHIDDYALVVAVPPVYVSTPEVYAAWDRLDEPTGERLAPRFVPPSLRDIEIVNDLYPAALSVSPEIGDYRSELAATWDRPVAMSGSGSALFAFFVDIEEAKDAAAGVGGMRGVRAVSPVPFGARVAPESDGYNEAARRG